MSGRRREQLSPTLFPFLAVLVCTLGTLILLLALVAQKATDTANQVAETPPETQPETLEPELAELEIDYQPVDDSRPLSVGQVEQLVAEENFRLNELVSFRNAQTADLEDRRDRLAHVEDHMRRIRQRLKEIGDAMERAASEQPAALASEGEIRALKKELAQAEETVKKLRDNVGTQRPRVVIVPHQGPNGTSRRPIYLECTAEGVTIWPENVKITKRQLENSDRDANPLDAALRAVRYHVTQNYGSKTPPYPMLIVRPDGIDSYYAARGAMSDWDDQFGYELVPSQVELAYQNPDANLKERVDYAVRQAVNLQTRQSIAGSFSGGGSGRVPFGGRSPLSSQRGLSSTGQATGQGTRYSGNGGQQPRPPKPVPRLSATQMDRRGRQSGFSDHRTLPRSTYGGSYGGNSIDSATATADAAKRRLERQLDEGAASLAQVSRDGDLDRLTRESLNQLSGSGFNGTGSGQNGTAQGQQQPDSNGSLGSRETSSLTLGGPQQNEQPNMLGLPRGENDQSAFGALTTDAKADSSRDTLSAQHSGGTAGGSAQTRPGSSSQTQGTPTTQDDYASQSSGQRSADPNRQPPSQTQPPKQSSLKRSGVDWALPSNIAGASGNDIIRSIRVQVHSDRFVLMPSRNSTTTARTAQTFPISGGDVNQATLQMASAIKSQIATWGAAIPGGRWSPRLQVEVMQGSSQRAGQLRQLMAGSGLEIQISPTRQATSGSQETLR